MKGQSNCLTPKLRFPEFTGAAGWETKKLADVLRFQPGYPFPSVGFNEDGNGLRLIRNRDLRSDDKVVYYSSHFDDEFVVHDGDILVGMDGDFTPCVWSRGRALLNQRVGRIIPKGKSNPRFLQYYLAAHLKDIEDATARTTVKHLSHTDVENLNEPLPEPAEQRKIAACLTSLDELLAAEGRKLEGLRTHKKGMMQGLFLRRGESCPRLRFPEFRDAGEWKEMALDDLAKRGTGHTPAKAIAEHYNGGIKWISLADSQRLDNGLISETATEISEQGLSNSSAVLHPTGTVVLSRDAGVGKSGIMAMPMAVSQHFITWTCHRQRLSNWFLYYLLQVLKPEFERAANGSTIKTIGMPFFIAMRVTVPEYTEQERIAACLSSLDFLIDGTSRKLEGLLTHKKGLMQQLFPPPEGPDQ